LLRGNAVNGQLHSSRDGLPGLVGQRVTSQRMILLDLIRHGGHLDAGELYERAKQKEPRLSISTVYRNLRLFVRLGLIEEHHFDKAHTYYEAKADVEHHHLICLSCGRIVEFEHALMSKIKQQVGCKTGFHIVGAKVLLEGFCAHCFNQIAERT